MDNTALKGFELVEMLGRELSSGTLVLPSFPDVAVRIRDVVNDPDADLDKVVKVVSSEAVLTGRLIKMANSALLKRGSTEVSDPKTAVSRMGFSMIRNAATAMAVEQITQAAALGPLRPHLQKLWHHGIKVAAIAYALAKKRSRVNPDQAMMAGLLHDIGKYYILLRAQDFPDIMEDPEQFEILIEDWHTGVGRAIIDEWGFGDEIATAADEHETLDRDHLGPADITDVVMVANLHAHMGAPDNPYKEVDWSEVPACKKLEMDAQASMEIMKESKDEIDSLVAALSG